MNPDSPVTVLLIMPPVKGLLDGFASGLVCLHSHLANRCPSVKCEILDLSSADPAGIRHSFQQARKDHSARRIIVGVTTTTATYQNALRCTQIAKEEIPHSFLVFGGHHATADARNILSRQPKMVDAVVIGEGERPLEYLVGNLDRLDRVPGLAYLKNGQLLQNAPPARFSVEELDELEVLYRGGLIGTLGSFRRRPMSRPADVP